MDCGFGRGPAVAWMLPTQLANTGLRYGPRSAEGKERQGLAACLWQQNKAKEDREDVAETDLRC